MKITPELIEKYHLGHCSQEEKLLIELWLETGIGEDHEATHPLPFEMEERSGNRIRQNLRDRFPNEPEIVNGTQSVVPLWKKASRYAAATAIVAGFIGAYFFTQGKWTIGSDSDTIITRNFKTITAPAGRKARFALPDGSQIQLNGGSTLAFAEDFLNGTREVKLDGEAYFDVARRDDLPFIIHTQTSRTEVLGTEFNLVEYAGEASARLTVTEGKVRFSALVGGTQAAVLTVGQQAVADASGKVVSSQADGSEALAWTHNTLVFDNEQFPEVARKIERWFGVKVAINNKSLNNQRYTGSYENPDLKALLKSLSLVLDFNYTLDKEKVNLN